MFTGSTDINSPQSTLCDWGELLGNQTESFHFTLNSNLGLDLVIGVVLNVLVYTPHYLLFTAILTKRRNKTHHNAYSAYNYP